MPSVAETIRAWDRIAPSYAPARRRPWPQVVNFIDDFDDGGLMLDLGCGGGRHTMPLAKLAAGVVAVDSSRRMLEEARRAGAKGPLGVHLVQASATALPFRQNVFDGALFIAALHNIPGKFARRRALDELALSLKPEAPALVTVWARTSVSRLTRWLAQRLGFADKGSEPGDAFEPWASGGVRELRFYHFYSKSELSEDIRSVGFVGLDIRHEMVATRFIPDNLFAVVKKPAVTP